MCMHARPDREETLVDDKGSSNRRVVPCACPSEMQPREVEGLPNGAGK